LESLAEVKQVSEICHSDIQRFADMRINLSSEKAKEHREQVNRLRERLDRKVNEDPSFGMVKMLHAGSVAKGTALATVNDLDVAVYVKSAEAPDGDPELIPWMAARLADANPQMERSQFEPQEHSVKVNYRGSGLNVDVVPVLYEGEAEDRGYLVRKSNGQRVLTSVPLHLDFTRTRKTSYGTNYAQLIRLVKWWKRIRDLRFKSFLVELIWAHLADSGVPLNDYPAALEQFFSYLVRTDLDERITFTDFCQASVLRGSAAIEVIDPVNKDNNVAANYEKFDRDAIVREAQLALDAVCMAQYATTKSQAVECWQVVLGTGFKG
jgi:hypothetical protein